MSFSDLVTNFESDFNQLQTQAQVVQSDVEQIYGGGTSGYPGDLAVYHEKLEHMKDMSAGYALMLLFYILGASQQNSTAMGYYTDKSALTGDRLKFNGLLTKVGNDLNDMTQSDSSNPQSVVEFCKCMDQLTNFLSNDPSMVNPLHPKHGQTMDPGTRLSIIDELQGIRKLFYLGNGPTPTWTYYFAPNGTGQNHMQTFADFQADLAEQGDVMGSTDAAKVITDNFGTNTQSTQTVSAVLNNDQKTYTSVEQAVQSFVASIAQWWNTLAKLANNHMTSP